ncbi:MAG: hypothetical protein JET69_04920 [Methanomassiliicoccales archaeon]|nr:hypothetical protein [Methanomassiliicoccales archaeon]
MFPPRWFLPYDAAFQLITALVALAVAVYALRGYQWVKEKTLYALFLAFTLLSAALLINSITLSYTYIVGIPYAHFPQNVSGADIGFWIYYIISIMAFIILVYAYASRLREASIAIASMLIMGQKVVGGSLLGVSPYMEMVLVALLVIIVLAQVVHLAVKRNWHSVTVTASFSLVLISHILILFSPTENLIHVIGRIFELAGFLSLLVVLYGLRRGK